MQFQDKDWFRIMVFNYIYIFFMFIYINIDLQYSKCSDVRGCHTKNQKPNTVSFLRDPVCFRRNPC